MHVAVGARIGTGKLQASERPSWLQYSAALTPVAILLIGAFSNPHLGPGLHFTEIRATIWVTTLMLLLALVLAPYSAFSCFIANLSGLYWTCGLLMFFIHLYFGVFTIFNGLADTLECVGALSAGFTCFLIGWWCLDVALFWQSRHSRRGIWLPHTAAQVFVFLVFAGGLVSHDGPVQKLGLVLVMCVLTSLAIRLVLPDYSIKGRSASFASERERHCQQAGRDPPVLRLRQRHGDCLD